MLSILSEKEKQVVSKRFGICEEAPKTLLEVGNEIGYSKERIRQLEDCALKKIRERKEFRHFREFIE